MPRDFDDMRSWVAGQCLCVVASENDTPLSLTFPAGRTPTSQASGLVVFLLRKPSVVLIQMLLPVNVASSQIEITRRELTAYEQTPAKGAWVAADGHAEQDQNVLIEVVADSFDRAWWGHYVTSLLERFNQESIHVRALQIELLDPESH